MTAFSMHNTSPKKPINYCSQCEWNFISPLPRWTDTRTCHLRLWAPEPRGAWPGGVPRLPHLCPSLHGDPWQHLLQPPGLYQNQINTVFTSWLYTTALTEHYNYIFSYLPPSPSFPPSPSPSSLSLSSHLPPSMGLLSSSLPSLHT